MSAKLDTLLAVETPEGVEFTLHVAGPVARAQAWLIDFGIRIVLYIVLGNIFNYLGDLGEGILLISVFILEWFYPVLFEVYRSGMTPGKQVMGLRVLRDSGAPVGWSASMLRNLLRVVDFLPLLYGFGFIAMLFNRHFQRIGDLLAGTVVVYREEAARIPVLPGDSWQDLPLPLDSDEQLAIVEFAERSASLTPQRASELADLLEPLTAQAGEDGKQSLYRMARGLMGSQGKADRAR